MILTIAYKEGRKRFELDFTVDEETANDPVKRAAFISAKNAAQNGRMVNWSLKEKTS